MLDVDLKDFFGSIDHDRLIELVEKRIGDGRLLRMLKRWLRAGVLEDGRIVDTEQGTPQGGVISPLLANVYLHYVLDEWFEAEVRPRLRGSAELVRYADDFVVVTAREDDARRIYAVLPKRLARFGLSLNVEKTRLLNFGRPRTGTLRLDRESRAVFDFLGFTHFWSRRREGWWGLTRRTARKRFQRGVRRTSDWIRKNRHLPVKTQHARISAVLRGHYAYYGLPGNTKMLFRFQYVIWCTWMKTLGRRSQRALMTRKRTRSIAKRWPLPQPKRRKQKDSTKSAGRIPRRQEPDA